ncbi:LLM class flavin-dependent oxidoreductase [Actinophytocola sp.]|uniref:LLM class flavin-dependent oxidoreductase n=1 Tax=Actinophytocola sp. TaxID=1872138 RepID=UPI002ED22A4B
MNVGITLPAIGSPGAFAKHVEEVGLESVWTGDHLISVAPKLDSTLLLAQAAATTSRLRLGFGVLILALRPVAWAAKQITTLQLLSGDRVLLGVGTGGVVHGDAAWRAVGMPFAERGPRTYAALAALPDLVAGRSTQVDGEQITLAPGGTMPPVLIGGGLPAMRRVVHHGYGWYPAFLPPATLADGVRELTERAGRKPAVTAQVAMALGDLPTEQVDAQVRMLTGYGMTEEYARQSMLTGGPEQAGEQLAALFAAGADRVVGLPFGGDNLQQAELLAEATEHARS